MRERMKGNTFGRALSGENNGRWRGDDVGYMGMHHRLRKQMAGRACMECGKEGYVEAALDKNAKSVIVDADGRTFSRNADDYKPLCASHHRLYDKAY